MPDGVLVRVMGAPKASRNQIDGVVASTQGSAVKVRVTAAPENGKANQAILKLLAKAWHVPVSHLSVASGQTDRHKTVLVAGNAAAQIDHLRKWAEDANE